MTWKEKLAKWVEDNQDEIVKFSYYGVGVVVGMVGTAYFANKQIRSMEICCGGMREGSNDTIFDVYLKNDNVVSWTRPFVQKPLQ